jgi:hypothetical protein
MTAGAFALQAALTAMGVLGRTAHRLHPTRPAVSEVAALFRDASPAAAARIAHAVAGARYQDRALVELARRRGQAVLRGLVDPASLADLRPFLAQPAIFVGWHLGPPFGVAGAFEAIGLRALMMRRTLTYGMTPTLEVASVGGGRDDRSAAFRRAVRRLEQGGVVLVAADVRDVSATAPVPCFGRARTMARGPFALARLTGAPLVPLAPRLDGDRVVRVAIGAPLIGEGAADALETSLAAGAAAWLEAFVRGSPGQLRRCVIEWLLEAPPLTPDA